jgi:hypothetical protein
MVDLNRTFRRIAEKAGLDNVLFHDLRQNAESRKMPSDSFKASVLARLLVTHSALLMSSPQILR